MMLRRLRRALALVFALWLSVLRYWITRLRDPMTLERRALWLQESCRQVLAALGMSCSTDGPLPVRGLIVANHLSYLDILVLSAILPCSFVAKAEVGHWPFFGRAARAGGTLFLERSSLTSANRVAVQLTERLKQSVPVLLFPEGTSTDGSQVKRFHSRLIEPAVRLGAPIGMAAIRYQVGTGASGKPSERDVCWYGDAGFLAHLWKVLAMPPIQAIARFGHPQIFADRRVAAAQTRAEIAAMRRDRKE